MIPLIDAKLMLLRSDLAYAVERGQWRRASLVADRILELLGYGVTP